MEEDTTAIVKPLNSTILPSDISEPSRLTNGSAGVCPLCESNLRLFFINFNEKLLMCENTVCEYPFGHEELQIIRVDNDAFFNDDVGSIRSNYSRRSLSNASTVTYSAWYDIQKLNNLMDTNEPSRKTNEELKNKESKEQLDKVLNDMKQLNNELTHTEEDERKFVKIKNEKFIKNLKMLQDFTGVQMLKPSEMMGLKKQEPTFGLGELKIDIAQDDSNMSCIKIEIMNNINETEKTKEGLENQ